MAKIRPARHPFSSVKTAAFFSIAVIIVLILATFIKVIKTAQHNIYDGAHQFVLLISSPGNKAVLIGLDQTDNILSILYLQNPHKDSLNNDLPIVIDAKIQSDSTVSNEKDVEKVLIENVFTYGSSVQSLTWIDSLRLYLGIKTINKASLWEKTLTLPGSVDQIQAIEQQFSDPELVKENITVQILNASNISGAGDRLETLLTNSGFNVIDVRTNQQSSNSSVINYYGKIDYTVSKLERILRVPIHNTSDQMIANIQIVIGKNGLWSL